MRLHMLILASCAFLIACSSDDDAPGTTTDDGAAATDGTQDVQTDTEEDDGPNGDLGADASEDVEKFKPYWKQDKLQLGEEFVLRAVWGEGSAKLVAVGNKSTIIEDHGTGWEIVHQDLNLDTLNGVWGSSFDDIWAVGAKGAILHRGPNGWNDEIGCSKDLDCDDGDKCTIGACNAEGACDYTGTGLPGCCGTDVFSEDWDDGSLSGWKVKDFSSPKTGIVWQPFTHIDSKTGEARYTSAPYALYFGNPFNPCEDDPNALCPNYESEGNIVTSTVTSPYVQLPSSGQIIVSFQVFIDTETAPGFDNLELRVVKNGLLKTIWTKMDVDGTTGGKFIEVTAAANEFAGDNVQFQFFFNSMDSMFNDTEGVYIDDFSVSSKCGAPSGEVEEKKNDFPTLWDVWGTGSDNVYAVGNGGAIIHWDGNSWKQQTGGQTRDFYGVGGSDEYLVVVGADGEALANFDGGLNAQNVPVGANLRDVVTISGIESIAVGDQGTIVRNGSSGWVDESPGTFTTFNAVWSDGASVVTVGDIGTIYHRVGNSWQSKSSTTNNNLRGLWGADGNNIYACGDKGVIVRYDGTQWNNEGELLKDSNGALLNGIIGFGAEGPIISVGSSGDSVIFKDGVWSKAGSKVNTNELHDVWGAVEDEVWAVGNLGTIIKWSGTNWSEIVSPTPFSLYAVWGRSQEEVYAVGQNGVLIQWDGTIWKIIRSSTKMNLRSVWGLSPTDIYAVGQFATIMHYDGLNWSQIKVEDQVSGGTMQPVVDQLFDIWGTSPTNMWAIGAAGTIVRTISDEESGDLTWVKLPQQDTSITLRGIWGRDEEHLWMAGLEGTVIRSNGQYLKEEETGSIATLFDIQGFENGDIVAVGDIGTVLRYVYEAP